MVGSGHHGRKFERRKRDSSLLVKGLKDTRHALLAIDLGDRGHPFFLFDHENHFLLLILFRLGNHSCGPLVLLPPSVLPPALPNPLRPLRGTRLLGKYRDRGLIRECIVGAESVAVGAESVAVGAESVAVGGWRAGELGLVLGEAETLG